VIHHAAARRVDQDCAGLHGLQRGRVDHVVGFRRQIGVQRHEVGLGQELIQLHVGGAELLGHAGDGLGVAVEDAHAEAHRAAGDGLADASHADDAQRRAVQVGSHQQHGAPGDPAAIPHVFDPFDDAARGRHEQRPGEIGRGLSQHAWRVAHGNAAAGAGGHVDVVEAHGHLADHLEVGCGVQQLIVDAFGQQAVERVLVRRLLQQRGARNRQIAVPQLHLALGGYQIDARLGHAAGDKYLWFHGYLSLVDSGRVGWWMGDVTRNA